MLASSVFTLVAAFAASAVAVQPRTTYATWPAKNFKEACSPGDCNSDFDVSAPAGYYKGAPAFTAHCHLTNKQGWTDCEASGTKVQASWNAAGQGQQVKVSVAHLWTEAGANYNATGSAEFAASETTFQLPVNQVTGVA
ncbi:hypothetical protein F4804DRAFT_332939 [Jackrogersella minutella]|nr:hypothetical protein F4804DRAFT_332939 [Jackrogersella minutella]